ncbi:MAG: single-stranded-DNA-specific exonuclease RecJ [Lachnospiraceae bacterium]|nr:single-stranded-DNA-specific exonuclease RecJ [Lachnospiraceae bacterium]
MREKWIVETKKGDFDGISKELGVSPLLVRCMINRGITELPQMKQYLWGTLADLHEPMKMKDMERAVRLLCQAREQEARIAIASDFDCDGIFSGYILWKGLGRLGLDSRIYTPDRVQEGYGLNERIVEEALADSRNILVTCDNGIAAVPQITYAKKKGMTVIVTDHHEVQEQMPAADAVLDPKREDETYPFSGLCGAGVAFKFICALYDACGIPPKEKEELLEYVAVATVADVMELQEENRILVKYGLKALPHTKNAGLRALMEVQGLTGRAINAGHIGFVLAPCFNAAGRIATVEESFSLLMETDWKRALTKAEHLKEINESRKQMTEEGAKKAFSLVEGKLSETGTLPSVLTLLLPDTHESLVGIIAGRVKERYNHPVIVFTRTEEGLVKGSGRSIDSYHMFDGLMQCRDLMVRFGGHKMAAGMTLAESDLLELERRLNEKAGLTEEDFQPVVRIDAPMPIGFVTERLIEELEKMEPFGVGNPKPVFAEQHFTIRRGFRLGREKQVLKLRVENLQGNQCDALCFGQAEEFDAFVREEWGERELARMYEGRENNLDVALTYYPSVNEYQGVRSIQIQIVGFCRVKTEK